MHDAQRSGGVVLPHQSYGIGGAWSVKLRYSCCVRGTVLSCSMMNGLNDHTRPGNNVMEEVQCSLHTSKEGSCGLIKGSGQERQIHRTHE